MVEVKIEGVYKYYGDVEAVKDLYLSCPDGEMLALLGPSGCGKTSTLKMIAGIEEVSRGEIRFDGRAVARRSACHWAPIQAYSLDREACARVN